MLIAVSFSSQYNKSTLDCFFTAWFLPVNALNIGFTVYLLIVGFLTYSWRYLSAVLKKVPLSLYLTVVALALLEYMGENAIVIPESIGEMVEEVSETIIYAIALVYLWRFKLGDFENYILHQPNQHEPCNANY